MCAAACVIPVAESVKVPRRLAHHVIGHALRHVISNTFSAHTIRNILRHSQEKAAGK